MGTKYYLYLIIVKSSSGVHGAIVHLCAYTRPHLCVDAATPYAWSWPRCSACNFSVDPDEAPVQ